MPKWERTTPWRQGRLLTADAAAAFQLVNPVPGVETAVLVISHDCDLAQPSDSEPGVEVIVGRFVDALDGNYTHCKNSRRLHVECSAGQVRRAVELDAIQRHTLPKDVEGNALALSDYAPCDVSLMTARERTTLQHWLAARYRRSAFPDEFDRRLKTETRITERLAKALKDSGQFIYAVFFDVDAGEEKIRQGADDPYELFVTLLYATDEDPEAARAVAETVSLRVKEIFRSQCKRKNDNGVEVWQWIELQGIDVIADRSLSYSDSQQLTKWQADHISLKAEHEQPILAG